jgi:hypothetical protein
VRVSPLSSVAADVVPDPQVVTRLLREQAPHLADMPVRASRASGSSNWVFRIGDTLAIRLPRSDDYVADLVNEVRWLPRLTPDLPVAVPDIVAVGQPSGAFPRPWAVVSWVPGDFRSLCMVRSRPFWQSALGTFLQSLHAAEITDVPAGPEHWGYRCGEPVSDTPGACSNPLLARYFESRPGQRTRPGPVPARGPLSARACSPSPTIGSLCPPESSAGGAVSRSIAALTSMVETIAAEVDIRLR